jgi:hypothetical protein
MKLKHPPPEATSQQTHLEELLESAVKAKQRLLKTIRKANRRHGLRYDDRVLVCYLPPALQALNRQYRHLEWRIDQLREEVQSRVVVRPDGETIVLPPGHSFAGFSEDGKVVSCTGGVVYDDGYEAAEHARHVARRAAIIEQYGSEEAYSEHCRAETERMRAARREAFRLERIRRDRGRRPGPSRPRPAPRQRTREYRPVATHRAASSSSTSSADPPDDDGDCSSGELRHISEPVAAELARIAERLRASGGVG